MLVLVRYLCLKVKLFISYIELAVNYTVEKNLELAGAIKPQTHSAITSCDQGNKIRWKSFTFILCFTNEAIFYDTKIKGYFHDVKLNGLILILIRSVLNCNKAAFRMCTQLNVKPNP